MTIIQSTIWAAAFCFGTLSASAQIWTPAGTPDKNWQTVAMSADGTKLFGGGMGWTFCVSTNSGGTWLTSSQPQSGSAYGSWPAIASSADGTILAAVAANVIWGSTNSGSTWQSNNVSGVSSFGALTLSADGSRLLVAAGAGSAGSIFVSTNLGATVTQTTAPTNVFYSAASSADGSKLFVAGYTISGSVTGYIYASTNSGMDWTAVPAPANDGWDGIASSVDGNKLVAVSSFASLPGLTLGGVYTSTNSGRTWLSNSVPAAQWRAVASSADGNRLVAVAFNGLIYTSTNSGTTWISNSVPNYSWTAVATSADGGRIVAVPNGDQSFSPRPIYIYQTVLPPQLSLTPSATNLTLAWTVPSTGFILSQQSNLTAVNWPVVTNVPASNFTNLQNQVTLPLSSANTFYRLKTP